MNPWWSKRSPVAAWTLAALLAVPLVTLWADTAPSDWKAPARATRKKNPISADDASLATGKAIFGKECVSCHGVAGKGDGTAAKDLEKKPGDLSKPSMWDQTDGALFWKITEGRKPMPSFEKSLSEDQRWHVINYVRTLAPKPATPPASEPAK